MTGAIEHPNVVPVHYVDAEADGSPLIVLKRIEGLEWAALVDDGAEVQRRFGATDLLAWNLGILLQVLNAVRFAHHRGVLHRDLKPSNVMIGDFGEVYLLDWGIAVSLRDDGTGRLPLAAEATDLAGTPVYMAPEMLGREGGPPLSERTDVYLAGAVLFELVAGRPPHAGATAIEVIASVIASKPVLPAGVPPELARICARALQEDPAQRFESIEAGPARGSGLSRASQPAPPSSAPVPSSASPSSARCSPRRPSIANSCIDCSAGVGSASTKRSRCGETTTKHGPGSSARPSPWRSTSSPTTTRMRSSPCSPSSMLHRRCSHRAKAAAVARHAHTHELEQLRAAQDTTIGRRTRTLAAVVWGLFFTLTPLVADRIGLWTTFSSVIESSSGFLIAFAAMIWWARDTFRATLFNRRIAAMGLFVFATQALIECNGRNVDRRRVGRARASVHAGPVGQHRRHARDHGRCLVRAHGVRVLRRRFWCRRDSPSTACT